MSNESHSGEEHQGGSWAVVDFMTGATDGFYSKEADAAAMLKHFKKEYPQLSWALVCIPYPKSTPVHLSEGMFWRNRLKQWGL